MRAADASQSRVRGGAREIARLRPVLASARASRRRGRGGSLRRGRARVRARRRPRGVDRGSNRHREGVISRRARRAGRGVRPRVTRARVLAETRDVPRERRVAAPGTRSRDEPPRTSAGLRSDRDRPRRGRGRGVAGRDGRRGASVSVRVSKRRGGGDARGGRDAARGVRGSVASRRGAESAWGRQGGEGEREDPREGVQAAGVGWCGRERRASGGGVAGRWGVRRRQSVSVWLFIREKTLRRRLRKHRKRLVSPALARAPRTRASWRRSAKARNHPQRSRS